MKHLYDSGKIVVPNIHMCSTVPGTGWMLCFKNMISLHKWVGVRTMSLLPKTLDDCCQNDDVYPYIRSFHQSDALSFRWWSIFLGCLTDNKQPFDILTSCWVSLLQNYLNFAGPNEVSQLVSFIQGKATKVHENSSYFNSEANDDLIFSPT